MTLKKPRRGKRGWAPREEVLFAKPQKSAAVYDGAKKSGAAGGRGSHLGSVAGVAIAEKAAMHHSMWHVKGKAEKTNRAGQAGGGMLA